jgi:hypothetical protein
LAGNLHLFSNLPLKVKSSRKTKNLSRKDPESQRYRKENFQEFKITTAWPLEDLSKENSSNIA